MQESSSHPNLFSPAQASKKLHCSLVPEVAEQLLDFQGLSDGNKEASTLPDML